MLFNGYDSVMDKVIQNTEKMLKQNNVAHLAIGYKAAKEHIANLESLKGLTDYLLQDIQRCKDYCAIIDKLREDDAEGVLASEEQGAPLRVQALEKWTLTDDASCQYVKRHSDTLFSLVEMCLINPDTGEHKVYSDTIDISDHMDSESIDELLVILNGFGYSDVASVHAQYGEAANQIIAECIFEYSGETRCFIGSEEQCEAYILAKVEEGHLKEGVSCKRDKPGEASAAPTKDEEESKPRPNGNAGFKDKYLVCSLADGSVVRNCFILRPDEDPAAISAMRAYAVATTNKGLAEDILEWVGKGTEQAAASPQCWLCDCFGKDARCQCENSPYRGLLVEDNDFCSYYREKEEPSPAKYSWSFDAYTTTWTNQPADTIKDCLKAAKLILEDSNWPIGGTVYIGENKLFSADVAEPDKSNALLSQLSEQRLTYHRSGSKLYSVENIKPYTLG